jgi:hypothetical protein
MCVRLFVYPVEVNQAISKKAVKKLILGLTLQKIKDKSQKYGILYKFKAQKTS